MVGSSLDGSSVVLPPPRHRGCLDPRWMAVALRVPCWSASLAMWKQAGWLCMVPEGRDDRWLIPTDSLY
jgi:hypothetical protein